MSLKKKFIILSIPIYLLSFNAECDQSLIEINLCGHVFTTIKEAIFRAAKQGASITIPLN